MSDIANNATSVLINAQVPEFVRNEHQTFVKFLEYYYKALERDGQQLYVTKNFTKFIDIDGINKDIKEDALKGDAHSTREESDYHAFLQKMYDNFINLIPDDILADRVLILKHAREFYRSRGSEKSVRFLMRALYNKEVTFYYPKQDVLRASDGKWFIEKSLKIKDIQVNNVSNTVASSNFVNKTIQGITSNATALVERVDSYYDRGALVYELKLSGIYKEFINAEKIFCYYTEEGVDKYLSAELFSGVISAVKVTSGGTGYTEGTTVPITSNGTGAQIVISKVTKGSIQGIAATFGGAGFVVNDAVVISGTGSGAAANVFMVDKSGQYHPNSYNIVYSTINLEANTPIGNLIYSNLNMFITDPANDTGGITNSMGYFTYSNCGPAQTFFVITGGNNYVPPLSISIAANTMISMLGILGRMDIIDGGSGYQISDKIEFINRPGGTGSGAYANVANVDANGSITEVHFIEQPGEIIGGSGYDWTNLPTANVVSGTGNGANIMVTASIGHNERLVASNSVIGKIIEMTVVSGGSGYIDNPVLRLDTLGDGTACAQLTVVTGAYSYPGRYINDDGHISSYNFLEDRDYYQNFSYVVKVDETINKYRKPVKSLIHPAGTRLYGEYEIVDDQVTQTNTNVVVTYANTESNTVFYSTHYRVEGFQTGSFEPNTIQGNAVSEIVSGSFLLSTANNTGTYQAVNNFITVYSVRHGYRVSDYVYLSFKSNAWANIVNSTYQVTAANSNYFIVDNPYKETPTGNVGNVVVNDSKVTITVPYSRPNANSNVYISFITADPKLSNGVYSVLSVTGPYTFTINHPMANSVVDVTGIANVKTHKLVVSAENHGFVAGEQSYLYISSGEIANIGTGYYPVVEATTNTFNVVTSNLIYGYSNTVVYQKNATVTISSHSASNNGLVYITFTSGDQSNTTNGTFKPLVTGLNTFVINTGKPAKSTSDVRAYYSGTNYSSIKFTRNDHGLSQYQNVWVEFFASATDLANGVYNVATVVDSSNYLINYTGNTSINVSGNTIVYSGANTKVNVSSNTIVYSGLGVVANSVMEGTSSVGLYK